MKPFIIATVATVSSILFAMLVTKLIVGKRVKDGRMSKKKRNVIFIVILVVIYVASAFIYFNTYARAGERAMKAMEGAATVEVKDDPAGYLFDGPGTEDALIFYPGAFVDEKAYAELMLKFAKGGVDCYLIKMPLHLAILGRGKADSVIERHEYSRYYISGHSLGAAVACMYAADNADKLDGLLALAGYSVKKIPDELPAVSVMATNDTVVEMDSYNENKSNWPADFKEVIIEGGNHSQYGDYGLQKGDTEATITPDVQLDQVFRAGMDLISKRVG